MREGVGNGGLRDRWMWEKGILGREGGREKERVGERDKNQNALDLTLTAFSDF